MLSQNQQPTEAHTKILDFFLSLGANKEKAEEILEILEKKNDYRPEPIDATFLKNLATKTDIEIIRKDIKIFEINITKDIDLKIEQLHTKLIEKMAENKNDTDRKISENKNDTDLKIEKLRTEAEKNKNSTIKWMFSLCLGSIAIAISSVFAMLRFLQ